MLGCPVSSARDDEGESFLSGLGDGSEGVPFVQWVGSDTLERAGAGSAVVKVHAHGVLGEDFDLGGLVAKVQPWEDDRRGLKV